MWDLRYATAPMRTLQHHTRGILSVAWCPQDADLLLSAAKDNLVYCWNPNSDVAMGEVRVYACVYICIIANSCRGDGGRLPWRQMAVTMETNGGCHGDRYVVAWETDSGCRGDGQPLPPLPTLFF